MYVAPAARCCNVSFDFFCLIFFLSVAGHQQREIYDRSRSTLFGFYPEFAGHHLSVLEQMPHVAAASTIENINTNHHPHGVGMMGYFIFVSLFRLLSHLHLLAHV